MTRSQLIAAIALRFPGLSQQDIEVAVAEILGAVGAALRRGQRVEIRGFGSFALNYRKARSARNPKTGEKVEVPGKWAPHFKAGKELRDMVQRDLGRITSVCAATEEAQARMDEWVAAGGVPDESYGRFE